VHPTAVAAIGDGHEEADQVIRSGLIDCSRAGFGHRQGEIPLTKPNADRPAKGYGDRLLGGPGVEYECLWQRLSERLDQGPAVDGVRSEFLYHMIHDHRQSDIGAEQLLSGLTHSQALARHMSELIGSEAALLISISQV
jgi:hypothetical protein